MRQYCREEWFSDTLSNDQIEDLRMVEVSQVSLLGSLVSAAQAHPREWLPYLLFCSLIVFPLFGLPIWPHGHGDLACYDAPTKYF